MTYGVSGALQAAVYQRLITDPALTTLVGVHVFDALPSGALPSLYVTLGPEMVRDRSDKTGSGAEHEFTVSVVTDTAGFASAKAAATAVSDALIDAPLILTRGLLISLNFYRAQAQRVGSSAMRQINLTFRALVEDN
jgi:hypothetical protein